MSLSRSVSVIVPSLGLRARKALILRAVESILSQEEVDTVPILVLNGQEVDPGLEEELRTHPGVRTLRRERANLPASLEAGRKAVDTPWFAELDDDDALLPGALSLRVRTLEQHPAHDVIVTNGYRSGPSGDLLHVADIQAVEENPLEALVRSNWLLPGSWLCRTETVGTELFQGMPEYLECTYLALKFSTRYRTVFHPSPTVRWNTGTPDSASKSRAYTLAEPAGLRRFLELDLPPGIRTVFRRRLSEALHRVAETHRNDGQVRLAWKSHLASLLQPGGLRFLPYSARLLLPSREKQGS